MEPRRLGFGVAVCKGAGACVSGCRGTRVAVCDGEGEIAASTEWLKLSFFHR